jgi:MerR family copper efflux transcriptional regulator
MLIAEFARATGLSRDTIRFYVKRGLLRPVIGASGTNRYQSFDMEQVERAAIIRSSQALGFTLNEIATLDAEIKSNSATRQRQIALTLERIACIDQQICKLRGMRRYLMKKKTWIKSGKKGAPPSYRYIA